MAILIIVSVLHGYAKVSQGLKFSQHPQYKKYLGIMKWLAAITLIGQSGLVWQEVIRIVGSAILADFIGQGIWKALSGGKK